MAEADESSTGETRRFVTFQLADETYGIDVMTVQEVLRVSEIAPVPGAPNYVNGIINLRGNVVTVIDTRKRLGLMSNENDDATRIVIIESDKQVIGMMVDSVADVVNVQTSDIDIPPNVGNDESSKYIKGVVSREAGLLILMDVKRLLSDDEWMDIAGF